MTRDKVGVWRAPDTTQVDEHSSSLIRGSIKEPWPRLIQKMQLLHFTEPTLGTCMRLAQDRKLLHFAEPTPLLRCLPWTLARVRQSLHFAEPTPLHRIRSIIVSFSIGTPGPYTSATAERAPRRSGTEA